MNFKNNVLYIICLFLLGFISPSVHAEIQQAQSQQSNKITYYTVKVGDTAYSVAKQFNLSREDIYKYNPGTEKGIKIGQTLSIPSQTEQTRNNIEPLVEESFSNTKNRYIPVAQKREVHIIKPKETLYSVAKTYQINVTDLININEGLSEETFRIGREIVIPSNGNVNVDNNEDLYFVITQTGIPHKVDKGETLYGISKQYSISVNDLKQKNPNLKEGLKEGMTITIPYLDSSSDKNYQNSAPGKYPTYFKKNDNVLRIGILLPFLHGTKMLSGQKITEYYEGFLIAIKELKKLGLNAEIYTFDIGQEDDLDRLDNILETNELNTLDLIIGGVSDTQIRVISNFSRRTGVKYVVPFTNRTTGVNFNPNMFQVINSHSALYEDVAEVFADKYVGYNIIFLNETTGNSDKLDFIKSLQEKLTSKTIPYKSLTSTASIVDDIQTVATTYQPSIVVLTSAGEAAFKRVAEAITYMNRKKYNISLFGYPEWQTFSHLSSELHNSNATFYSIFYLSDTPKEKQFETDFRNWYNKDMIYSTPKYAPMGYDTGMFFITAISEFGDKFPNSIDKVKYVPLEIPFFFKKISTAGGYLNEGLFFINYAPNGEIKRSEIR